MWIRRRGQCAPGLNNPSPGLEDGLSAAVLAVGKLWEQLQEEWSLYLNKNEKWERDKRHWGWVLAVLLLQWKKTSEGEAGEEKQPWKVLHCPAQSPRWKLLATKHMKFKGNCNPNTDATGIIRFQKLKINAPTKIAYTLDLYIVLHKGVFFPSTALFLNQAQM